MDVNYTCPEVQGGVQLSSILFFGDLHNIVNEIAWVYGRPHLNINIYILMTVYVLSMLFCRLHFLLFPVSCLRHR